MDVDAIRGQLRHGTSRSLRRRRRIGLLAAIGAVDFAIISLYQMGVIRHLPDPPGGVFDSDKVNASRKAYATGIPDGTLGLALYGATMVLAAAGGTEKTGRHPILDVLLGGVVVAGAGGALQYLYDMARNKERACPYCLAGAAAHFAMLPLVLPEATASARKILSVMS